MAKVIDIVNESKRSGEKNGKRWNIMTVDVDKDGETIVADSFDKLEVGDEVILTYSEEYKNYSAKKAGAKGGMNTEILKEISSKLDKIIGLLEDKVMDIPEFKE